MVMQIYKEALGKLMEKPLRLWGISLLYVLLVGLANALFAIIPGVALGLTVLFETAMTLIFLHGFRGEKIETLQLFDCFRDWATAKRVLCGMGWMLLWIFIWSLIPIVGPVFGIIRTYEYRLTPYILMQEPEVKPSEAIKLSKERTDGWKGKMFLADILIFLAFFFAMLILVSLAAVRYIGWIFALAAFLLSVVFMLFATLFLGLVQSAFYEKICGREAFAEADVSDWPEENVIVEPFAPIEEPEAPIEEPEAPIEEPEAPIEEPEAPIEEPEAPAPEAEAPEEETSKETDPEV